MAAFLKQCGLPLQFVDGEGLWAVTIGGAGRVEAVVRQAAAPDGRGSVAEVVYAADRALGELVSGDGVAYVVFTSTPGPVVDVVEQARDGLVWRPSTPKGEVRNDRVADAVVRFAQDPGQRSMIDVLRACLAGELLVDVTGSDPASPVLRGFVGANDVPAIGVFTDQGELARFLGGQAAGSGAPQSLALPGVLALQTVLRDAAVGWVYVNPAGPTCALARPDLEFALQGPPNAALREVVLRQGSQQELFTAMLGDTRVFLGEIERNGRKQPLTVPVEKDGSTEVHLAVFTSAAEVAAFDPAAAVRAFTPEWVVQLVFGQRLAGMLINPAGPSATIGSFQIWHLLDNPSLDGPPRTSAGEASSRDGSTEPGGLRAADDPRGPASGAQGNQSEPMVDQRQLEVSLARQIDAAVAPGWDSIRFEVIGVGNVYSDMLYVVRNGVEESQFPPTDLPDSLVALKKVAYRPEVGTWLGFTMTLTTSGALTVDYTFDDEPDFDSDPSPRDYELELELFPRAAASIPEWWRQRIVRSDD
ncbi:hypothetical protein C4K88_07520 [Arthrobacter pityocampae]|uniref:SseB protein N-terminal domain-containing protein n=1 Tax=Arthrobacter pityocampae TaxID=547334 RepID=A0A2S5IYC7_9MICC|nr:hypothetical protein C4K88_07520 [Arthrobacter pityocampae]